MINDAVCSYSTVFLKWDKNDFKNGASNFYHCQIKSMKS